jgi:hypothetical protein
VCVRRGAEFGTEFGTESGARRMRHYPSQGSPTL